MNLPIRLLPAAREEFDAAAHWYEKAQAGLGESFVAQIDEVLSRISLQPRQYVLVHEHVRKAVVKRFPFVVLFRLKPTEIIVIAVFHTMRSPSDWLSRV